MVAKTKYKINGLAKDFGFKTKDFAVYAEKAGLKEKGNMAALDGDEFDVLLTVLTLDHQISDIGAYLNGETYIKTERPPKEVKKPEEPPKPEQKPEDAKQTPAPLLHWGATRRIIR